MKADALLLYLKSSGTHVVTQVVRKLSGFLCLWLLNQTLSKAGYGDYALAFTLVGLIVIVASGGLENAVMYRVSRLTADGETEEETPGRTFASAALGWSLLVALAVTAVVLIGRGALADVAGKPAASRWLALLSLLVPIGVARGIYRAWFEARQKVPRAMTFAEILPAAGRALFLGVIWLVWPTPAGVATAVVLAEAVPLALWAMVETLNPLRAGGELSAWDAGYSAKLMLTRGLNKLVWQLDVVLVGLLSTSEQTAEYSVASSLALLLMVGHRMVNQVLKPRIGRLLEGADRDAIEREYREVRALALLIALGAVVVFTVFGDPLLELFGDYGTAEPVLLVLSVGYLSAVSFGMNGGYLNIAGYAGWTLGTTLLMVVGNLALNILWIPKYGALGAAMATAVSLVSVNSLISLVVYRLDQLRTYSVGVAVVSGLAASGLTLTASGFLSRWIAVVIVAASAMLYTAYEWSTLHGLAKELVRLVRSE